MPSIIKSLIVPTAASAVWPRLADPAAIDTVLDFLEDIDVDGDRRRCVLVGGGVLEERILAIDHEHRRIAYTIESGPLPFSHHSASMTVVDTGDGRARITWITDYAPEHLAPHLEPLLDRGMASIARVFSGTPTQDGVR
jgi:hypothetical protein